MLYNYQSFGKIIREIIPFNEENKQILAEETRSIIKANAIGIPLLAIIQGLVAYLGYVFSAHPILYFSEFLRHLLPSFRLWEPPLCGYRCA